MASPCSPHDGSGKKRHRKTRLNQDASIVIIGCGLGALSAAISLEQAGFTNISLYERDTSACARREGYGLTLSYNPKGPLAQMGLLEEVAQRDCPSRSHYIFAPDGSILGYYGNAFLPNRGKGQRGNLRVPRQVLRQIMLDRVKAPVYWSKKLTSFAKTPNEKLRLEFEDGSVLEDVDLLVGGDGIRSAVLKNLVGSNDTSVGLQYLDIMIILGIADFIHPHLDERGFYTLDGRHRLFTMPYEGSKTTPASTTRRIMWQLSYRLEVEAEARRLSTAGPQVLREEVLKRCRDWHVPVVDMIKATPLETIWGTALMDRDPKEILDQLDLRSSPRVVALGDAVHCMSPFKGQGANQALLDGPLLASWLQNASVDSAVRSFWREMVQRTAKVVAASREAAGKLHSPEWFTKLDNYDFAGVKPECVENLLKALKERGIGADNGSMLDQLVQKTIDDLGYGKEYEIENKVASPEHEQLCKSALAYAAKGDCVALRNLSLKSCNVICDARDKLNRSCLHLAVLGGHCKTCRWLLTEAGVSPEIVDVDSKSALVLALASGREDMAALIIETQR